MECPLSPPLQQHQQDAVDAALRRPDPGDTMSVISLPTGAGKTRVGVEVAKGFLSRGRAVLLVSKGPDLVGQAAR